MVWQHALVVSPAQIFLMAPPPLKKGGVQKFTMVPMGKYSMLLSLVPATVAAASCLNLDYVQAVTTSNKLINFALWIPVWTPL